MHSIPNIIIPIIENGTSSNKNLRDELQDKRVIIFGVPGAFTPTCSEKHFPGFIKLYDRIKSSNIDDIYCLSVNDPAVMQAWQTQYSNGKDILMIADGNADLTKSLELDKDYSKNYMGLRSKRFAMVAEDKKINIMNIEQPGEYKVSAAEYIMNQI